MGEFFSIALKAGRVHRPVGSVLEFQQNEPQNQWKIVTPMNNKEAAISKMMELAGDK